jgi:hypothetical protein
MFEVGCSADHVHGLVYEGAPSHFGIVNTFGGSLPGLTVVEESCCIYLRWCTFIQEGKGMCLPCSMVVSLGSHRVRI